MVLYHLFGALAQLVAHNTGSVGVRSSNLLCSTNKATLYGNVIQIRMTERELELKYVPVSFFVKKTEKKG